MIKELSGWRMGTNNKEVLIRYDILHSDYVPAKNYCREGLGVNIINLNKQHLSLKQRKIWQATKTNYWGLPKTELNPNIPSWSKEKHIILWILQLSSRAEFQQLKCYKNKLISNTNYVFVHWCLWFIIQVVTKLQDPLACKRREWNEKWNWGKQLADRIRE